MVKEDVLMKDPSSVNCMNTAKDSMMKKTMKDGTAVIMNAINLKKEKLLVMLILTQIAHAMMLYVSSIKKTDTAARELVWLKDTAQMMNAVKRGQCAAQVPTPVLEPMKNVLVRTVGTVLMDTIAVMATARLKNVPAKQMRIVILQLMQMTYAVLLPRHACWKLNAQNAMKHQIVKMDIAVELLLCAQILPVLLEQPAQEMGIVKVPTVVMDYVQMMYVPELPEIILEYSLFEIYVRKQNNIYFLFINKHLTKD